MEAPYLITQMDVPNNIDVRLPSICSLFLVPTKTIIDQEIGSPGHGKYLVNGLNACYKQHLKRYMKRIIRLHEGDEGRKIKPCLIYIYNIVLIADECRGYFLEGKEF